MKLFDLDINSDKSVFLDILLEEHTELKKFIDESEGIEDFHNKIRVWVEEYLDNRPDAKDYYLYKKEGRKQFDLLQYRDYAAIRILDYLDRSGEYFIDHNLKGKKIKSAPFEYIWNEVNGIETKISNDFIKDMIYLVRQFKGRVSIEKPSKETVLQWMERHPSGLDPELIELRKKNKDRIIRKFIEKIDSGEKQDAKFYFHGGMSFEDKYSKMLRWWNTRLFQLRFAIRTPELLNEMLDNVLSGKTKKILEDAKKVGIPTFVNPYYLSLINVNPPSHLKGTDEAIREYVFYSERLVEEFGSIEAWEKEDIVEPGIPNAAGWLLPGKNNIHRRYPNVAILIPETMGRACGGLCSSCQRMYDFQNGNLNFKLKELFPNEQWGDKLVRLMTYFENDSQLRDILITGGDALMNSDKSLLQILNAVYDMALNKINANKQRKDGEKYAEMLRVRLGTRLPIYLPQRITPELIKILAGFKEKASKIGIKQFVIQTHFETAMEITPDTKRAVEQLLSAGWIVTNQQVFITGASKRGHTAKLRKVLNDIGVLPYYTFTVKGFYETSFTYATIERAMHEQIEEKVIGKIPSSYYDEIQEFPLHAENMIKQINSIRNEANLPFLATDRNVLNLPAVGKSQTYRTIGITKDGRRILEFEHDHTQVHSPIIEKMGKIIIIESKSISTYIRQMRSLGEDIDEYNGVFGYSIGETETRIPIYDYPKYSFTTTAEFTNIQV